MFYEIVFHIFILPQTLKSRCALIRCQMEYIFIYFIISSPVRTCDVAILEYHH